MMTSFDSTAFLAEKKLDHYVKEIFVIEDHTQKAISRLPFYADGYPGIIFQRTVNGTFLSPSNKPLSTFFMYGQTIRPIEIVVQGNYQLIVFQLFPFAASTLFGIDPKELNDDCHDLNLTEGKADVTTKALLDTTDSFRLVEMVATFLTETVRQKVTEPEQQLQVAINTILNSKGKITIKSLINKLNITERTLQRQFEAQVGISPKQFAKIIQFQSALAQLSEEAFSRVSEIVHDNGYADQSHFIRNFKKFTGKKPSQFKNPE